MNTIAIKVKTMIFILLFGMIFYGCTTEDDSPARQGNSEEHSAHNQEASGHKEAAHSDAFYEIKKELAGDEVLISEKQMKMADIRLGKVTEQSLSRAVKSFGEVVLAPSDEATVNALVGGVISNIRYMEGDYVEKGEVLARIVHPDIVDMQQNYLEALNQHEYLRAEYHRQKRLQEDSVNSKKTVQNARAAYQTNMARLNSLKKKLHLIHINTDKLNPKNIREGYALKAPISGYVAQVKINTGNHITPQQSLFHITANEKAHIDLKVYEKDISQIATGQKITFNLANNPLNRPMKGEVMKMAKRFDPEQRTAVVHARVQEMNEHLLPGMSVVAYIQTGGEKHNTLPETAFVSDRGKNYVFLLKRKVAQSDEHEDEKEHQHKEKGEHQEHENHEKAGKPHFYVFKRMKVDKVITQGTISGFRTDRDHINDARFAINNAQAILSEMKKGGSGHGHAH